jgi:uncharacterized protein involved in exopolysaccharide biosynthesis
MGIPHLRREAGEPGLTWEPEAAVRFAWRHKAIVILGSFLGLLVGGVAAWFLPPVYQSSAQILVVKKRPDAVTGVDTRQMSAEEFVSPAQDLLKSFLIINRAIREKELAALPSFVNEELELTDVIRNALTVTTTKGLPSQGTILKLYYRGPVPDDCRAVLTGLLASFKDFIDAKHQTVSKDTIELILREKHNLERELAEKETAYQKFRAQAPLLGKGKDGLELRQERFNSIQAKRSGLLLQRVEVEAQLASLEAALKAGRGPEALRALLAELVHRDAGEHGREKTLSVQEQLFPLLLEERKLLDQHGAKHPEVLAVRHRIEAARRLLVLPPAAWKGATDAVAASAALDDPVELHLQLLRQRLQHVKTSEELLAKVFQSEQDEARQLAVFEIQNEAQRSGIAFRQQLFETLVKRFNEVSLVRDVGGYEIEVMEPPAAGRRVAPNVKIVLMIAAFLGAGAGLVWAGRREWQAARRERMDLAMPVDGDHGADELTVKKTNGTYVEASS